MQRGLLQKLREYNLQVLHALKSKNSWFFFINVNFLKSKNVFYEFG